MKKEYSIQMLGTDKPSSLLLTQGKLYFTGDNTEPPKNSAKNQFLYVTSTEEIKSGDWVCEKSSITNEYSIFQVGSGEDDKIIAHALQAKKIVVSTDESLGLPLIPESIILKFIERYNKGERDIKVWLEMETLTDPQTLEQGTVKLNDKNEVIEAVEESIRGETDLDFAANDYADKNYIPLGKTHDELDKSVHQEFVDNFKAGAEYQKKQSEKMYSKKQLKDAFEAGSNSGFVEGRGEKGISFEAWIIKENL